MYNYHTMHKDLNTRQMFHAVHRALVSFLVGCSLGLCILGLIGISALLVFEKQYQGKIYPTVTIDGMSFAGKTPEKVKKYWEHKNTPFEASEFTFIFQTNVATISGTALGLGYDSVLTQTQAYIVGRSGNWLSDMRYKLFSTTNITPYFRFNEAVLNETLDHLGERVAIPVQEALFEFQNGRVVSFRPSRNGRRLNKPETKQRFVQAISTIPTRSDRNITIPLLVETVEPTLTTDRVNSFGIKELIGRGYSEFKGSIPGRIHNVKLASAKLNGILIKPGEIFSFNDAVGDISASTGFQQAYIIKEGRTVLGDGGGVCQVSSTLFRAALAAGLPIVARTAHAYRVHYYEEGGFKPGLDATVFAPSVDLKIRNDTPAYILIQTKTDTNNLTLTFELYGTNDGRKAKITNHKVWDVTPPPPDLYQDDPTLPLGRVKQVDWAAWGAKASFDYRVTRNGETLQNTTFYSNFRPWQAVFLRGTAQ